jgi:hypothetical protein
MIVSFRDKRTRQFAEGNRVKAFSGFERQAEMKLDELESATSLLDLDQCFRETSKKELLYSLPLEGATPGGGDYLFCYLKMLPPSPQPPPLKGGGVWRQ